MTAQQRIRLARRHAGLSQAQLAEAVGVQRSAVSHWEAPQGKNPSVTHLREVALATGVQFEWLATGRGEMGTCRASARWIRSPRPTRCWSTTRSNCACCSPSATPRARARLPLVEIVEQLAQQRTGRPRGRRVRGVPSPHAGRRECRRRLR